MTKHLFDADTHVALIVNGRAHRVHGIFSAEFIDGEHIDATVYAHTYKRDMKRPDLQFLDCGDSFTLLYDPTAHEELRRAKDGAADRFGQPNYRHDDELQDASQKVPPV